MSWYTYWRIWNVRGLAYRVLRDTSEADDLLQDFFILIQRKWGMFDPSRGPARFWILQMAYHCALPGVAT
jgi:RNA polymerase sigma-70 factor, ECF subfamily